ncbi:hypothetical protein HPB47_000986 [Ixodes persulcatus]|uniref:Uncharacterized protein n=1 Tax=Ixodes persulcatus TaxID=34615 RepID=A0AC60PQ91_IXOPE|nr:hypothetical protein HPB47_000986 [Ixodes persulcatus]
MEGHSSTHLYAAFRTNIAPVRWCGNTLGSRALVEARGGAFRTLTYWKRYDCTKPGFAKECFEKVFQETQKEPLFISLLVDEINIKTQVDWDGKEVVGYCDLGQSILKDDCIAYAKHALVFLAVVGNRNWKLPLEYALIDVLDGTVRSNLVQQCLIKLKEADADCLSVTCDVTSCNLSMLTALGVILAEPRMKS